MPDFIRKISAKNVFRIIKTCSASGVPPQTPVSGALPPKPLTVRLCPWTPLGNFRPQTLIYLPRLSSFQCLEETLLRPMGRRHNNTVVTDLVRFTRVLSVDRHVYGLASEG